MKYFSPSVLDGSITTAKLADDAVTSAKIANGAVTQLKMALNAVGSAQIAAGAVVTSKLSTVTDSQAGTIAGSGEVVISVGSYNFFPDIEAAEVADEQPLLAMNLATPSASADSPQFRIQNSVGPGRLYSVAWRRVSG